MSENASADNGTTDNGTAGNGTADNGTQAQEGKTAGLFDLRFILAILFGIYGIVVTIMGAGLTSQANLDKTKAADGSTININLWSGLVMLVAAIAFAAWAYFRPVKMGPDFPDELPSGTQPAATPAAED